MSAREVDYMSAWLSLGDGQFDVVRVETPPPPTIRTLRGGGIAYMLGAVDSLTSVGFEYWDLTNEPLDGLPVYRRTEEGKA